MQHISLDGLPGLSHGGHQLPRRYFPGNLDETPSSDGPSLKVQKEQRHTLSPCVLQAKLNTTEGAIFLPLFQGTGYLTERSDRFSMLSVAGTIRCFLLGFETMS